jgi:hypothetical protein
MSKKHKQELRRGHAALAKEPAYLAEIGRLMQALRQIDHLLGYAIDVNICKGIRGMTDGEAIKEIDEYLEGINDLCKAALGPVVPLYTHNEHAIPPGMMPSILRYVDDGLPVGDFLRAVISNDLMGSVGRGDDINVKNLPAFCAYFHNHAPAECHGSQERYKAWIRKHETQENTPEVEPWEPVEEPC